MKSMIIDFSKRVHAGIRAFKVYKEPFATFFEEDIFISAMRRRLTKYFPDVTQNRLLQQDICEAVYRELKGLGSKSRMESATGRENELIAHIIQKFCLVAGVASAWELEIKFFSGKLGLDVYYEENPGEHIETKAVRKLVNQILQKYPKIDCRLDECREIRNGLLHGNLQQLKVVISKLLTPEQLLDLDPKMAIINLSHQGTDIQMANKEFTKEEAMKLGPFFWFLSGSNSRLLDYASTVLEKGLQDIGLLVSVFGLSYDKTSGYFDQLARYGRPWNAEQRHIFTKERAPIWGPEEKGLEKIEYLHKLFQLG